ncbi:hypothetical protein Peur_032212 [Populus x canadensis]
MSSTLNSYFYDISAALYLPVHLHLSKFYARHHPFCHPLVNILGSSSPSLPAVVAKLYRFVTATGLAPDSL